MTSSARYQGRVDAIMDDLRETLGRVSQESDLLRVVLAKPTETEVRQRQLRAAATQLVQWNRDVDKLLAEAKQLDALLRKNSVVHLHETALLTQEVLMDMETTLATDVDDVTLTRPGAFETVAAGSGSSLPAVTTLQEMSPPTPTLIPADSHDSSSSSRTSMPTPPPHSIDMNQLHAITNTPAPNRSIMLSADLTNTPTVDDLGLSSVSMSLLKKDVPTTLAAGATTPAKAKKQQPSSLLKMSTLAHDDQDDGADSDQELENLTAQFNLSRQRIIS